MKELNCWFPVPEHSDFSIYNLPFGIFSTDGNEKRAGIAIGKSVIDLLEVSKTGILASSGVDENSFRKDFLNDFIGQGKAVTNAVRELIQSELCNPNSRLKESPRLFIPSEKFRLHMPVFVRDYTDFYSSLDHASNVGKLFRDPENALFPNWRHLPVAYHGRASSIIISGTDIRRPKGQIKPDDGPPQFGPARNLDFELEMAFVIGKESNLGQRISTSEAAEYIFGMVLFNDWSARDIQKWEYIPLGPFLSKNFASSISPWIVTMEAIEGFKVEGPKQNPEVLPYLQYSGLHHYDIHLEVELETNRASSDIITRSNYKYMYWNMVQQLAHHTVNGCNISIGDLLASGTISGPNPESLGCLLEMSDGGKKPIRLSDGSERLFLQDGDSVRMKAFAEKSGVRVGFGELENKILPSI